MSHEISPGGNASPGVDDLRGDAMPLEALPPGHPDGAALGDYLEPFARTIEPGPSRPFPPTQIVERYVPPIPGAPPGVVQAPPAMVQAIMEGLLRALDIVREKEGALPTKEERMHSARANAFTIGVATVQLDAQAVVLRSRRAVMITNTDPLNTVWYGYSSTVRVGDGGWLAPGGGTVSLPIDENVQVWVVATGAGTIVSFQQFA